MTRTSLIPRSVLAFSAVLSLAQCKGGKTEAAKAEVTIAPQNPIVISADTTYNGVKVSGPWSKFYLTMENDSNQPITVVAITGSVFSTSTLKEQDISYDPNAVLSSSASATTCTYTSFGTWAVGEKKAFSAKNGSAFCDIDPVTFLMQGLEKPTDKNQSYRYRVVLKLLGWFGTFDNPTDRFERKFTFYTR